MSRSFGIAAGLALTSFAMSSRAAEKDDLAGILGRQIIGPQQTQKEVEDYVEARIPRMPQVKTVAEWERHANRIRAEMFEKVVYRGEAAKWRGHGRRKRVAAVEHRQGAWHAVGRHQPHDGGRRHRPEAADRHAQQRAAEHADESATVHY